MNAGAIPVLETDRLRLRSPVPEDLAASTSMWSNPEVVRHIGGTPFTQEEVWARILRYRGMWSVLGFGFWSVEEKSSGRFVGDVGFGDFHRDLKPSIDGLPEMGWVLDPAFHGKGYASEAVGAAMQWAGAQLAAREYACIIDPANAASIALANKVGFRQAAETLYKGKPILVFRYRAQ